MRKLRWLVPVALAAGTSAVPAAASAAPGPVTAWYMYGTTLSGLESTASAHACTFAANQPGNGTRNLLLDFGAARKIGSSTWGAVDFSNTTFKNADIRAALERAADGYHNCHVRGGVDILYGNSNYHMASSGMSNTDAWYAGYHQSEKSQDVHNYQVAHGYTSETSDAVSDMETSWDGQLITKQLVNGDTGQGWALYDDYGSADGCPQSGSGGSCNNGWDVGDVGYVSFHGHALPLPEIYYTANANQWTVVRKWWNNNNSTSYFFRGTTGSTGVGLTATGGWNALNSLNSGLVGTELVCFGC